MHSRQYRRLNRDDLKRRLTADELNTMPDRQYRRLEDHYRAMATRKGLQLRKARTRDPSPRIPHLLHRGHVDQRHRGGRPHQRLRPGPR